MATSVLHIKTEIECKVFLFDEEKGIATTDKYFNLESTLKSGSFTWVLIFGFVIG